MRIGVVGAGYVGLVAGVCLAEMGNDVTVVDRNARRIDMLCNGLVPHYEPGLHELLLRNQKKRRLVFTTNTADAVVGTEAVFMAVGTPPAENGALDLTELEKAVAEIAEAMDGYRLVVIKSTVPPGTCRGLEELIASRTSHAFDVVSNPEFLKEGCAVNDFMRPDRLIIGARTDAARDRMRRIYAPFFRGGYRIMETDPESSEMIKYASNVMLAARISLINEIAGICQAVGADVEKVRVGVGLDHRLGEACLHPGLGYGGSCFPKDVRGMAQLADSVGVRAEISHAVDNANRRQREFFLPFVEEEFGADWSGLTFCLLGLAYKPHTDDVREAPALALAGMLLERGARVRGYDPEARERAEEALPELEVVGSVEEAARGADALFICTEWDEFRRLNWEVLAGVMKRPVVFDGRNIYDLAEVAEQGVTYYSIGRSPVRPRLR